MTEYMFHHMKWDKVQEANTFLNEGWVPVREIRWSDSSMLLLLKRETMPARETNIDVPLADAISTLCRTGKRT